MFWGPPMQSNPAKSQNVQDEYWVDSPGLGLVTSLGINEYTVAAPRSNKQTNHVTCQQPVHSISPEFSAGLSLAGLPHFVRAFFICRCTVCMARHKSVPLLRGLRLGVRGLLAPVEPRLAVSDGRPRSPLANSSLATVYLR